MAPDAGEGQGRRALITGLSGFTSAYLAQELRHAGYRVFGSVMPGAEIGADCVQADLTDRAAVARMVEQVQPDVVAHLAAIAFVAHADAEQFYRVNIVGTRNLLEALAAQPRKSSAVLLASSANVYGNASAGIIDEDVAPAPANEYAVSKLAMEYAARLWSDRLPIVIARPFNYTGVGQGSHFLLPKIVNHFRRRARVIELGNLDVARDFSDVRSVAACYRRLLADCPAGQTINVCSGQGHTLAGVLDSMTSIAGYQIEVRVNPALVRTNEVQVLVGSNAKLRGAIGPVQQIALADTLRWMYQAC
jgi:nucleoside-diphosphate-sugar epimerase